jgi:hypothetical protein
MEMRPRKIVLFSGRAADVPTDVDKDALLCRCSVRQQGVIGVFVGRCRQAGSDEMCFAGDGISIIQQGCGMGAGSWHPRPSL